MCELMILVEDITHPDFYINISLPKTGDVLVAQEDGSVWGSNELNHASCRVVSMPGVRLADALYLLAPQVEDPPPVAGAQPSRTLRFRARHLDLTRLMGLYYDTWMQSVGVMTTVTQAQALADATLARPFVPDPSQLVSS